MSSYRLGLDIGSNSVGSAAVDKEKHLIRMGVSVFPAGVEESETKRGAPKNQARRVFRSQRRITRRRAARRHQMRSFLLGKGWIPDDSESEKKWLERYNPWLLRREGLKRELKPDEFGRVLLHMAQRRGAYGFGVDGEDNDTGKIKDAISNTRRAMKECGAETFGELMAIEFERRRVQVGRKGKSIGRRVRNRRNAAGEDVYEFCVDRELLWEEFDKLWNKQRSLKGELAKQLTDKCRKELDDSEGDEAWRYKGILFGQRKTYWDVGTMARCDLEPTDMKCPKADMYAQEFRVLETVNNIRVTPRGELKRALKPEEREKVIAVLEKQKTATEGTIRKALGIDRGQKKGEYTLSLERDRERGLNTNWFKREIISAMGKEEWEGMSEKEQESINRAILKFDPQEKEEREKLRKGCGNWWGFSEEQANRFIDAWSTRAKIDDRASYSRKAIKNLLPYMREGLTVNEARNAFAEDAENEASDAQRERYCFGARAGNKRIRQYVEKHPNLLPPAPEDVSNPVVRKAIHEVRRHVQAYIRELGCKPERVVVELAREARQSALVRNRQLAENRAREKERKEIIKKFDLEKGTKTQQRKAVDRVLLCREQKFRCAYCGDEKDTISEATAAKGEGVEVDHIIPESRGGNSYLSNLVLCHTRCNRGKGNKTPMEWLGEEEFGRLEQRLKHLEKSTKWRNLHREVPDLDGFVESQLTDAAYASRQVVGWLEKTLYGDKNDGKRRVLTTKGRYTAILRRDWRLFPERKENEVSEEGKNRADHRHHAIDAVITALSGPERLSQLAHAAEKQELAKSEGYAEQKRERLEPPWGDFDSFRSDVMKEHDNLIVAHRPEGRKITGGLHNDTLYGPVLDRDGNLTKYATIKKPLSELSPRHLRVPKGWKEMLAKLERATSKSQKRKIRGEMLGLKDVVPGKSGVVRDRWFRQELREGLRTNNIDPDDFSSKQVKELLKGRELVLRSGVPIRHVTILRAPTVKPVGRKWWNPKTGRMEPERNQRSVRLYEPQNNHHIEIREDKKGKWVGEVVTNYDAAKRVRPPKESGLKPQPAVNRNDTEKGKFVMSLSIGEMLYMKHPETGEPDYFVVFKIDKTDGGGRVHLTVHSDGGRDKETERCPRREDVKKRGAKTGGVGPADLQELGVERNKGAQKVWVGPLGDVKVLRND